MKIQQEITESEKVRWLYQAKALDAKAHDLSSNWDSHGRQENQPAPTGWPRTSHCGTYLFTSPNPSKTTKSENEHMASLHFKAT